MMSSLDALFAQVNRYPLTAKVPINQSRKGSKIRNEVPLISQSVANAVATVAWSLASPRGQSNIQKSIEISVKRKFFPYLNAMARGNKRSLHHIYEWEKIGITSARLFDLKIPQTSRGKSNFSMRVQFRPSKTLVPLTSAQATPNPNTGEVVKRQHIFWNKAMTMEYGETVVIRPLGTSKMAFDNPTTLNSLKEATAGLSGISGVAWAKKTKSGLTFTSRPIKIDYSKRPTYHALDSALTSFFMTVGRHEASKSLKKYNKQVARGAGKATHMLTVSTPSDAYAHSVASKIANSLVVTG